ncbi:MAG: tol-pal system protein [Gammaproteobacteria bacterium]|nr:tol-pal system protein [Gammaproteobacteria bacterium]
MPKLVAYSFIFFLLCNNLSSQNSDEIKTDILFLKIQELEAEIAQLRDKVESQNFLIEKLIAETTKTTSNENMVVESIATNDDIVFKGIQDPKSKDQIFGAAIEALENQKLTNAYKLFDYFVKNFDEDDRLPLAYFWLGEISFINNDFKQSEIYFMELISTFPDHYRVPLAHKKIGDIYLNNNENIKAKNKYNFVVREFPNNTASSLALQLLKNME